MEAESKQRLTIGEFLKQMREKKGLSLEYVAEQLKLKVSTVKALEANAYEEIGSLVYIKGYLRSYARLLHVNIERHLQIDAPPESAAAISAKPIDKDNSKLGLWFIVLALIVIVIIAFAVHHKHAKEIDVKETNIILAPAVAKAPEPIKEPSKEAVPTNSTVTAAPAPAPVNAAAKPESKPAAAVATETTKSAEAKTMTADAGHLTNPVYNNAELKFPEESNNQADKAANDKEDAQENEESDNEPNNSQE